MTTKTEIRKSIRLLRNSLSEEYKESAAQQCCNIVINANILKNNLSVACYLSHDNELDLKYLLEYCFNHKIQCFLPAINNHNATLKFIEFNNHSNFVKNKYNIPEPIAQNNHSHINPKDLDIVFMPLVAFTKNGLRLGMGGGYYDRTFAFLNNSSNNTNISKPKLIGIAYDLQCVNNLPKELWDIKLHGIATETKFIEFKQNN